MKNEFLLSWISDELEILQKNKDFINENSGVIFNNNDMGLQEISRYERSLYNLKNFAKHGLGD